MNADKFLKTFYIVFYNMSLDGETLESKIEAISKKINVMSKQVKQIMEKLNEKVEIGETVGKSHGKPSGNTFEEKQKSYMEMLNDKRIKEPKQETLQYYKIQLDRESGNYVYF